MHELARHPIHSTETLKVATRCANRMIAEHRQLSALRHCSEDTGIATSVSQELDFMADMLENLKLRSAAVQSRLQNEINLVCSSFFVMLIDITKGNADLKSFLTKLHSSRTVQPCSLAKQLRKTVR